MAKTNFCDSTLEDQEREKKSNMRKPNICSEPKRKKYKLLLYGWKQKIRKTAYATNAWKREWKYFNHFIAKMLELNTDSSR